MQSRRLEPSAWEGIGTIRAYDKAVIDKAKSRAREDLALSDWLRQGHVFVPGATVEPKHAGGPVAHETVRDMSVERFVQDYEAPNLPCVIDGCAEGWPAMAGAWEPRRLYESYRHRRFRCGEDNAGYPVKMKLKYFLRYWHECKDDSPMYVFDSMYNDDKTPAGLLHDYRVPHYFKEDLFAAVGEHRRPPYRWMLLGPKRSGTGVHIDPLATSAWNTLLYGRKRWVIFSPSFTKGEVKGRELVRKDRGEDDEPVDYFMNILPRVRERIGRQVAAFRAGAASTPPGPHETPAAPSPARAPLYEPTGEDPTGGLMMEFTQYPGETVFVPGGWWHAVMNLDDTIAVTQNFASSTNFARVWAATRDGRRGMARKWLRALRTSQPDLAAIADASNKAVGWEPTALAARHKARVIAMVARLRAKAEAKAAARGGDSSDDSDSSDSSSGASTSSGSVTSASSGSRKGPARKPVRKAGEPCSSEEEA